MSLLRAGSRTKSDFAEKTWSLGFMQSPLEFIGAGTPKGLVQVDFSQNQYQNSDQRFESSAKVVPKAGDFAKSFSTTLAFRSIGYKSEALPGMQDLGIHFDDGRGVISNDYYGRIMRTPTSGESVDGNSNGSSTLPGLYCAGWVKRGPAGVIANTMEDAFATAGAMAGDWESRRPFLQGSGGWDALSKTTDRRELKSVSWTDWLKIDAAEKARGRIEGKEREKFTSVKDMMAVLD